MEAKQGDVVVGRYPYTNLNNTKKRPLLVINRIEDDFLVVPFTNQEHHIGTNIEIKNKDLKYKNLNINVCTYIRCHKLSILSKKLIDNNRTNTVKNGDVIDTLKEDKLDQIIKKVIEVIIDK